jgi:GNAT superfamily N-acetyltransferase
VQMHQQLSADTLYKRYHIERIPSHDECRRICALDGKNGRSFLALLPGSKRRLVGLATYVAKPALPIVAEVALLVADAYQGQGIGRKLMNRANDGQADSNVATVSLTVVSAADQIDQLAGDVQALADSGAINGGQSNALITKLQNAATQLAQADTQQAINMLNAFINQVTSLIDTGVLTPAEGQPLIDAANAIINSLS